MSQKPSFKVKTDVVWSTKLVNECIEIIQDGGDVPHNPFYEGDITLRKGDIVFEYTPEEQAEIIKCADDPIYFAEKYGKLLTDEGIANINLRDYQREILNVMHNKRYVISMQSRQSGKCLSYFNYININGNKTMIGDLYFKYCKKNISNYTKFILYYTIKFLLNFKNKN